MKTISNQDQVYTFEFTIKKSRFVCYMKYTASTNEAQHFIDQYIDVQARHNCYAYIIGDNQEGGKKSDDGEPAGSAGSVIYNFLYSNQYTNITCLVIRYFGGIKLGLGPLTRAYKKAAQSCLETIPVHTIERSFTIHGVIKIKHLHYFITPGITIQEKTFVLNKVGLLFTIGETAWKEFKRLHQRIFYELEVFND